MRESDAECEAITHWIRARFCLSAPLGGIFAFPGYDVYIFYHTNAEIEESARNGLSAKIEAFAEKVVAKAPGFVRGSRRFSITFDSLENVKTKCNGDMFKYLR